MFHFIIQHGFKASKADWLGSICMRIAIIAANPPPFSLLKMEETKKNVQNISLQVY
jgi:hypothetical protein